MINCQNLYNIFKQNQLTFFTGVPDSTFKGWMTFLDQNHGKKLTNIIAANECEAVAIATGYHLGTGDIGVVYLQNSGFGKGVNPLTSLCDKEAYSIQLLLMIGWRGKPDEKDEPQHRRMGKIMQDLLGLMDIPYEILPDDEKKAEAVIKRAVESIKKNSSPFAIIVPKGIVEPMDEAKKDKRGFEMKREEVLKILIQNLDEKAIIVSTTGKTSRELYELRAENGGNFKDFYMVGSMGCAPSIALGIALTQKTRPVIVIDGDGASIMQMGAQATVGHYKPANYFHFLLDNGCHDSTGAQPTVSKTMDFQKLSLSCGYLTSEVISTRDELIKELKSLPKKKGPAMFVVNIEHGSRKELGRPATTPLENKQSFMAHVKNAHG